MPLGQIDEAVNLLTGEACKVLLVPSLRWPATAARPDIELSFGISER
jgi:hypothetical protein